MGASHAPSLSPPPTNSTKQPHLTLCANRGELRSQFGMLECSRMIETRLPELEKMHGGKIIQPSEEDMVKAFF